MRAAGRSGSGEFSFGGDGSGNEYFLDLGLLPAGWTARRAASKFEIDEFAIYIGVVEGVPYTDDCDDSYVCRDEEGWYFQGRAGVRARAWEISTPHVSGFRGDVETGQYLKSEGYFGSAQALMAVLHRDGRVAVIISDMAFDEEEVFDGILRSFNFTPRSVGHGRDDQAR